MFDYCREDDSECIGVFGVFLRQLFAQQPSYHIQILLSDAR